MIYKVTGDRIEVKDVKTGKYMLTLKRVEWYSVFKDFHIIKIKDDRGCLMFDTRYYDFLIGKEVEEYDDKRPRNYTKLDNRKNS